MNFSETFAACDLKVGRCRQLIEVIRYVSIEGQGHFFTIYFLCFVCFVLYLAKISGERLQDHWSSGWLYRSIFFVSVKLIFFALSCMMWRLFHVCELFTASGNII